MTHRVAGESDSILPGISRSTKIAVALAVFALPRAAGAQTNTWLAAGSGDWSSPGNWSLGVPVADQAIYSSNPAAQISVGAEVSTRITGLQSEGALYMNGGALSGLTSWTSFNVDNVLTLNGGSLSNFNISATGGIVAEGPVTSILDTVYIANSTPVRIRDGQLEVRNSNYLNGGVVLASDQALLKVNSTALLNGPGVLHGYGTIENDGNLNMAVWADAPGKTLVMQNPHGILGMWGARDGGVFDLYGTTSYGTLTATSGGLVNVYGPISLPYTRLIAEDNSQVRIKGQLTVCHDISFTTSGSGQIVLDGGQATGTWDAADAYGMSPVRLSVTGNSGNAMDGLNMGKGHSLVLDNPTGDGSYLEVRNSNYLYGGVVLASDQALLKVNSTALLNGPGVLHGYGTIENDGNLNMAVWADAPGKTLLLRGDGFAYGFHGETASGAALKVVTPITGYSWLSVSGNSQATFAGAYTGSATWHIDGTLEAPQGIVLTWGSVDGDGHIAGSLINQGAIISPGHSPGTLSVDSFAQSSSGKLVMQIAGNGAGDYDVLQVLGNAQLGGTLQIEFLNGYLPQPGDTFGLLYSGSAPVGHFDSVTVDGLTPDYTWNIGQNGQILAITFVPEPTVLLVGGMSATMALALRRRQT